MLLLLMLLTMPSSFAQLRPDYYATSCPNVKTIVRNVVQEAMLSDPDIAAARLRQHYHDFFDNGCDASNLLDNSPTIRSEKDSPALKFARGYEVTDKIKSAVEASCPGVVSCADIVTLAAETSVSLSGGPSWTVMLGRKDGTAAFPAKADVDVPSAYVNLSNVASKFFKKGLDLTDLVALSGAHTIGRVHCSIMKPRLYNSAPPGSPGLNPLYLSKLQETCPENGGMDPETELDLGSPRTFDNSYFINLQSNGGLLITDQDLYSTSGSPATVYLVNNYSHNQSMFFDQFVHSMIKMGNINPLTGNNGEIRLNCRKVNNAN
uniref:Peroxidase n=2 Tax=Chenopodium quinoa TaxID=63459 RepID=A0A803L3D5_CHEQI